MQNLALGGLRWPQAAQTATGADPHSMQNLAAGGLSA